MVTAMDEMLGNIVDELQSKGMYENSIIIFSSDNGGQSLNGGASNLPLRGNKGTYYEGGVRVPAFVHSPSYVKNPGYVSVIKNSFTALINGLSLLHSLSKLGAFMTNWCMSQIGCLLY